MLLMYSVDAAEERVKEREYRSAKTSSAEMRERRRRKRKTEHLRGAWVAQLVKASDS